jgi:REP element-mobilizing transposase RayT
MEPRRRLPHLYPLDKLLFVTWHLYGSLPYNRYPPPGKQSAGQAFVWMDRYLDTARTGPLYLGQEAIARIVQASIHYGAQELKYYDLNAYVIMANHVHLLVLPRTVPSRFLQTLKGYTARQANLVLNRTGHPFWQSESYDHLGTQRRGRRAHQGLHRKQSGQSRIGYKHGRLSMV